MEENNYNSTKRKKIVILFVIDFIISKYGFFGGTEKQLIEKINKLDKKKFKPILVCLQKRYHNQTWDQIECEKIPLHIYSLKSPINIIKFYKLYRILKEKKVDVLESVFFDSILISVVFGKFAGIKNIITCRRDMGFWYNRTILKILINLNRHTNRILVNSNAIKKNVAEKERIVESKVDVIYNGIDIKKLEATQKVDLCAELSNVKKNDKIVGMVANFNRNVKRLDIFIKSIKIVCSQYNNVKFVVIGDGKLKQRLINLSREYEVNEFIIWAGARKDPVPFIKNFNVGVISSDSEGLCNAILEYMAAGVPVVATEVGGNIELIQDGITGFLIPKGNYELLGKRIIQLLEDDKLAQMLGINGKIEVSNKYSWEKIIDVYETYYSNLVETNA